MFVNLDCRSYLKFLNWMPAALKMPEPELIQHAGLDSAVYLRIYLLGLKIFVPIAVLAFVVMVRLTGQMTLCNTGQMAKHRIPTLLSATLISSLYLTFQCDLQDSGHI